jgi:hypothetical protein
MALGMATLSIDHFFDKSGYALMRNATAFSNQPSMLCDEYNNIFTNFGTAGTTEATP